MCRCCINLFVFVMTLALRRPPATAPRPGTVVPDDLRMQKCRPSSSVASRCCTPYWAQRRRQDLSERAAAGSRLCDGVLGTSRVDLLGNSLSSPPSAQANRAAWEALEKARSVPAKSERDAAGSTPSGGYFRDYDSCRSSRGSSPTTMRWQDWRRPTRMTSKRRSFMR